MHMYIITSKMAKALKLDFEFISLVLDKRNTYIQTNLVGCSSWLKEVILQWENDSVLFYDCYKFLIW